MTTKKLKRQAKMFLFLRIISILLLIASIIFIIGTAVLQFTLNSTLFANNERFQLKEPISIALFGIDTDDESSAGWGPPQADAIILVTLNPQNTRGNVEVNFTSVPRDTEMFIACGAQNKGKVNSSMGQGFDPLINFDENVHNGSKCSVETLEQYFGINIDYYMSANFGSVVKLVDAIGGIEIDVAYPFCDVDPVGSKQVCVEQGKQTLNGEQALVYARQRKVHGDDWERNIRQQQVVAAVIKKILSDPAKYSTDVAKIVAQDMVINIPMEKLTQILNFATSLLNSATFNFSQQQSVNVFIKDPTYKFDVAISPLEGVFDVNFDNITPIENKFFFSDDTLVSQKTLIYPHTISWLDFNVATLNTQNTVEPINVELQFTTLDALDYSPDYGKANNLYQSDTSRYYYSLMLAQCLEQESNLSYDVNTKMLAPEQTINTIYLEPQETNSGLDQDEIEIYRLYDKKTGKYYDPKDGKTYDTPE